MAIQSICDSKQCTACFACMAACPKGAILQTTNDLGEVQPLIDAQRCVSCGRCVAVCPSNHAPELRRADGCFAAWSRHDEDLEGSSSGGVAAVLSRKVISAGGVVYGAVSRDKRVFHDRIATLEGAEALRGSKYVKSDTSGCFQRVREDLKNGRNVLFIGTPCQVAGLRAYVGGTCERLLTVDLICHGTPPFAYLREYLDKMCGRQKPHGWDTVRFRFQHSFLLRAYCGDAVAYQQRASDDLYYSAFLDGMIFRDNCYRCPYARPERIGHLTIGDFWGLDRKKLGTAYDGKVSVVLPNTPEGLALLRACGDELNLVGLPIEDALNPDQGNLLHPSTPHRDRADFIQRYPGEGFCKAIGRMQYGRAIAWRARKNRLKQIKWLAYLVRKAKGLYHRVKRT